MLRKTCSLFVIYALCSLSPAIAVANSKGSWDDVKGVILNQGVVVKLRSGKTISGYLRAVDDKGIKVQLASGKKLDKSETLYLRDDVRKLWRAEIMNRNSLASGALIGAGVGAVALGVPAVTSKGEKDGLEALGFFIGAIAGGVVGGVIGYFVKKKYKKIELIYSID